MNNRDLEGLRFFTKNNSAISEEKVNYLSNELFGLELDQDVESIAKETSSKLEQDINWKVNVSNDDSKKRMMVDFKGEDYTDDISKASSFALATGLPNPYFIKAEELLDSLREKSKDFRLHFSGQSFGGSLAQYFSILSESETNKYESITWNGIGIESFTKFQGNEFLGYKLGLEYYLNQLFDKDDLMGYLYRELDKEGVFKEGSISLEYRFSANRVDEYKLKGVLLKFFYEKLEMGREEAINLVEENFDPKIIEIKMRFIDNYKLYQKRISNKKDNIINYIISDNIPARIFKHIGTTYLIDQDLKRFEGGLDQELINRIENLEKEQLEELIVSNSDLFQPFMLLAKEANGQSAKNRFGDTPKIGNMTNNVSLDYLRSLVKDIVVDLKAKDENFLVEIFKLSRERRIEEFSAIIKDRLSHSMKLQQKLSVREDENIFESRYLKENPDLLTDDDKAYFLAQTVLEQFKRMDNKEIKQLWSWEITAEGVFLDLGRDCEEEGEVKEYHSSTSEHKFNNEELRLKVEFEEPSLNRIYGSLKQNSRYTEEKDTEYIAEEKDAYIFAATQGIGSEILTQFTNPERPIKIDQSDISGSYDQVEELNCKTKIGGEEYYGDNIVFTPDNKQLVYLYGPNQKDKLVIDGFKNGDYGINLVPTVKEGTNEQEPVTYTPHQVKFDAFEFKMLDKMEMKKSINDHTRISIRGIISEDNLSDYERYLEQEDPKLIITYDNDDSKLLFKGIIEDYSFGYENYDYYLNLEAVSYSILLERRRKNRIYQNLGTTYQQAFDILLEANPEFNLVFADDSLGSTELVSEDYPLILQYKEREWDFIKRVASYLNQIVVVDDSKDDSETVNIQLGPHETPAKELNNIAGAKRKKIGRKNINFNYYEVSRHAHFRSENIFDIGSKVNYNVNNGQDDTLELIIVKNTIYMEKGMLYSDFTLVKSEDINLEKVRREISIEGRSFRAEVKKIEKNHTAQVQFIDIEDEFDESTAYYYPIDKPYTNAYFAPEVGDIVDIYFKSKNEKHATLKSSSTDKEQEVENEPTDKLIITPEGYKIKINNESILISAKDDKFLVELKEESIKMLSDENTAELSKDLINLKTKKGTVAMDKSKTELSFGGKKIEITNSGINLM